MMATYEIDNPKNCPGWCKQLTSQLSKHYQSLHSEIVESRSTLSSLSDKLDSIEDKLIKRVSEVEKRAIEAVDMAHANAAMIKTLNTKLIDMSNKFENLSRKHDNVCIDNKRLQGLHDQQETYSRRDNLLIRGINEQAEESDDMCIAAARRFFIDEMKLDEATVNNMTIVRCHRIGKLNNEHDGNKFNRPVIVRFLNYNDRMSVWAKRFELANGHKSISENFANNVEYRRRLLYPILKKAKQSPNYQKVYLKRDVLVIDDVEYSFDDNLHELPPDLHPKMFSYKSNDQWIIFGGQHSVFNFMSNFFPVEITHDDVIHSSSEQAYQYAKASRYKDSVAMQKILHSRNPSEAKRLGYRVKNFDLRDWNSVKDDIMKDILRVKFQEGSDLAGQLLNTSGKSLAYAGMSKTFAIGMSLNSKNIFDTSKWPKNSNVLGKCLMAIRTELTP